MQFPQALKNLMDSRGLSNYQLAKELDIHPTTVANWLNGKIPRKKTQLELATYFNVSVDYLMGNEQKEKPILTQKDELDIKKRIDDLLFMMSHQTGLMFDGEPLSPEALESVKSAMLLGMTAATLKNKEKYNPNKNKKDHTNERNADGEDAHKKVPD